MYPADTHICMDNSMCIIYLNVNSSRLIKYERQCDIKQSVKYVYLKGKKNQGAKLYQVCYHLNKNGEGEYMYILYFIYEHHHH